MFEKNNEKRQKIQELTKRFEYLKLRAKDPNLSQKEFEQLQNELAQINKEIDELL